MATANSTVAIRVAIQWPRNNHLTATNPQVGAMEFADETQNCCKVIQLAGVKAE